MYPFHFYCDIAPGYLINNVELIGQKHIQISVMKRALLSWEELDLKYDDGHLLSTVESQKWKMGARRVEWLKEVFFKKKKS